MCPIFRALSRPSRGRFRVGELSRALVLGLSWARGWCCRRLKSNWRHSRARGPTKRDSERELELDAAWLVAVNSRALASFVLALVLCFCWQQKHQPTGFNRPGRSGRLAGVVALFLLTG